MTDWAEGIEARNHAIKNEINTNMLSDLMRTIVFLALLAGALLFCSWIRNQIIYAGYESQNLFAVEESLKRMQKRLTLEEETLENPERIDMIARNDLGMAPLRPSQLILHQLGDPVSGAANQMAMVDSKSGDLKKVVTMKRLGDYVN
jgi:cell division protein FtsL